MKPYYEDALVTIYHGDCREVLPILRSGSVRLLWTDPPYGHGNQDGDLQSARMRDGVKGGSTKAPEPIRADVGSEMKSAVSGMLTESVRLMCADCCCCCCCAGGGGPTPTFAWLAQQLDAGLWRFFHAVVWDKTDRGPGLGWKLRRDYEFVMMAHRRGGKLSWTGEAVSNIWRVSPEQNVYHPNQKPEELIAGFIQASTSAGELVMDPFAGSGTTLVAAKRLGRKAIGIEIEERYCEVAAGRCSQGSLSEMFQ